jgi:hypothetical protein
MLQHVHMTAKGSSEDSWGQRCRQHSYTCAFSRPGGCSCRCNKFVWCHHARRVHILLEIRQRCLDVTAYDWFCCAVATSCCCHQCQEVLCTACSVACLNAPACPGFWTTWAWELICLHGACCCGPSCMNLLPTAGSTRLTAAELPANCTDLQDSSAAMSRRACCVLRCAVTRRCATSCYFTVVSLHAEAHI